MRGKVAEVEEMTNRQKVRPAPTCQRQTLERSSSPGGKDKVIKEAYCPRETSFRVCGGACGNTPQPEGRIFRVSRGRSRAGRKGCNPTEHKTRAIAGH